MLGANFYKYRSLFICFCLSRLALLIFFEETPSLFINHYENAAIHFLNGDGFSVLYENALVPFTLYPPGFSFFIASVYKILGVHALMVQIIQIFLAGLSLVLFVKSVEQFFPSQKISILFGYFYLLVPIFWITDISLNTGASLATSFALISFYFLFKSDFNYRFLASGLLIAMAVSIRSEYIILVPTFLIVLLLMTRKNYFSRLAIFLVGCSLVLVPMSVRNYKNFQVLTPLPAGAGLTLVNVIGKFYPNYEKGFAFGDGNVLKAEGNKFTDLTYPDPYGREKARLKRSMDFMKENPDRFFLVLVKNTPRAWFGHQLNLVSNGPGFQEHLSGGGGYIDFAKRFPLKFLDIFLGFTVAVLLFWFTAITLIARGRGGIASYFPILLPAISFLIFFIVFGTLGRYTLPAYIFLSPLAFIGIREVVERIQNKPIKSHE